MARVLSLFLILSLPSLLPAQLKSDQAVTTFKVSPGISFSLWAAEPECVNPTCMDVDHRGRVWMVESINYRQKLRGEKKMRRPEGDRIVILEDKSGGGKCDSAHTFYQSPEIHAPLGIAVWPYPDGKGVKVYVCQSPDILVFEDKNDDGKADGAPTKLLTGFRGLDHDHGVHGILVGPDNRLYFTVGDSGVGNLQSSDGKGPKWTSNSTDVRAATVWRCDLDGKNLELIAHNFRNNYEPCVDSFGTVFLSDNDDDGNQQTRICYVMKGGNYGYHPRGAGQTHWHEEQPGVVPKIIRTYFGSPTGICMYEGSLLPKEYRGNILHTDAGPRHVRCYHLEPEGAAYAVKQENMMESSDNWFRPSDVCVAPDGSVFVCDWYDPGVGGHGIGDFTRGRIYRIAPDGKGGVPAVDLSSDEGILKALASPNLSVRAMAMAKIHSLPKEKALEVLAPAATQKEDAFLRARALWQMGKMNHLRFINAAFSDPDPRFRVLAMRILKDTQNINPTDYDSKWREQVLADKSGHVLREAILMLQDVEPGKAIPLYYELAKRFDGKDRFYLAALGIAAGNTDAKRRAAMLADFDKHMTVWTDAMVPLLWELRPPNAVAMLTPKLTDPKLTPGQRAAIVEALANTGDATAGELLAKTLSSEPPPEVVERIVSHLQRGLGSSFKGLKGSKLLHEATKSLLLSVEGRAAGLTLVGLSEATEFKEVARTAAKNPRETLEVRLAAVSALGGIHDAESIGMLGAIAEDKEHPLQVRLEAIRTLGRDWNWISATRLLGLVTGDKAELPVRQQMVAAMAGHKTGAQHLLQTFQDKKLSGDLTADLSRLLRNSPFPDIKKKAQAVLPAPPKFDPKNLPSIPALLARKGNTERGKQVFLNSFKNDVQCMKCHRIEGAGGNAGPELTAIGAKESREKLLESILYPDRAINHQYATWTVEDMGGRIIQGILAEETPEYIVLRDATVKDHKINVKQIADKKKIEKSIMPDNLMLYMSEDDLLDLVEYLYSLKGSGAPTALRMERWSRSAG